MRRLHTVGKHEKFVASGVYKHVELGVATGLREHWSIHDVGGAQFIRVDVDGRDYDGRSILIETLRNPAGQFERVDEHHYSPAAAKPQKISHTFFDDHVELIGLLDNQRIEETVMMPAGYGLFSHSWLLTGMTIQHTLQQTGTIMLLRLDMQTASFAWTRVEAAVESLGQKSIQIGERDVTAQCYRWQNNMIACVDPFGVILCAETPAAQIVLTQYARRPEPKPA